MPLRLRPKQFSVSCSLQKPPNPVASQSYKSIEDGDPISSHGFKPIHNRHSQPVHQVSRVQQQLELDLFQSDPVPAVVQEGSLRKNSNLTKVSCEHCGKSMMKCNINRHLKTCPALKKKTSELAETSKSSEKEAQIAGREKQLYLCRKCGKAYQSSSGRNK